MIQNTTPNQPIKYRARVPMSAPDTPDCSAPPEFLGPVAYLACTTCGVVKSMMHFSRHSASKFKRNPCCLDCNSAQSRNYFATHKATCAQRAKQYRADHADDIRASKAAYFQANKERVTQRSKQWMAQHPMFWAEFYARHKERLKEAAKLRRMRPDVRQASLQRNRRVRYSDPDKASTYQAEYRKTKREELVEKNKAWREENPELIEYIHFRRTLHIGEGGFLTWKEFRLYTAKARELTRTTGVRHTVDHIYPLCGDRVSGLNIPANLRIVPWSVNSQKTNKLLASLSYEHYATEPWEVFND